MEPASAIRAYRRPQPRLAEGRELAPIVHAMMDVSDGVLIDAERMARDSGLELEIALDRLPLSEDVRVRGSDELDIRLAAAPEGEDYQVLLTATSEDSCQNGEDTVRTPIKKAKLDCLIL